MLLILIYDQIRQVSLAAVWPSGPCKNYSTKLCCYGLGLLICFFLSKLTRQNR